MDASLAIYVERCLRRLGFPSLPARGTYVHHGDHDWLTVTRTRRGSPTRFMFEADVLSSRFPSDRYSVDVELHKSWERAVRRWVKTSAKKSHDDFLVARRIKQETRDNLARNCEAYRQKIKDLAGNAVPPFRLLTVGENVVGIEIVLELKGTAEAVVDTLKRLK